MVHDYNLYIYIYPKLLFKPRVSGHYCSRKPIFLQLASNILQQMLHHSSFIMNKETNTSPCLSLSDKEPAHRVEKEKTPRNPRWLDLQTPFCECHFPIAKRREERKTQLAWNWANILNLKNLPSTLRQNRWKQGLQHLVKQQLCTVFKAMSPAWSLKSP